MHCHKKSPYIVIQPMPRMSMETKHHHAMRDVSHFGAPLQTGTKKPADDAYCRFFGRCTFRLFAGCFKISSNTLQ